MIRPSSTPPRGRQRSLRREAPSPATPPLPLPLPLARPHRLSFRLLLLAALGVTLFALEPAARPARADDFPSDLTTLPDEDAVPQTAVEAAAAEHAGDPAGLEKAIETLLADLRARTEKLKAEYEARTSDKNADLAVVEAARDALAFAQEREHLLSREAALLRDQRSLEALTAELAKEREEAAAADLSLEKFLADLPNRPVDAPEVELTAKAAAMADQRLEQARKVVESLEADLTTVGQEVERLASLRRLRVAEHRAILDALADASGAKMVRLNKKLYLVIARANLSREARSFLASRRSVLGSLLEVQQAKVQLSEHAGELVRRKAEALSGRRDRQVAAEEQKRVDEEKSRLAGEERRLQELAQKAQSMREKELLAEEQGNLQIRQRTNDLRGEVARWKKERSEFLALRAGPRREAIQLDRAAMQAEALDAAQFIDRKKALDQEIGQQSVSLDGIGESIREAKSRLETMGKARGAGLTGIDAHLKESEDRLAAARSATSGSADERAHLVTMVQENLNRLKALREERIDHLEREISTQQDLVAAIEEHKKDVEGHLALLTKWREELVGRHAKLTTHFLGFELPYPPYVAAPAMCGLLLLLMLVLNFPVRHALESAARKTATRVDDDLVKVLLRFTNAGLVLAIGYVLVNAFPVSARASTVGNKCLLVVGLAVAFTLAGKASILLLEGFVSVHGSATTIVGPLRTIVKILAVSVGGMVILDSLSISIAPLLATLGVGSVAIALALQDTLSNLFAGVYVVADRPISIGDYIKLDSGQEGFVVQISWRSTRIRTLGNNIIIIPNQKVAASVITNYNLPEERIGLSIPVSVSYDCDPERVERVLVEVAKAAAKSGDVGGLLSEPPPSVRFSPGFGASSLDFTLSCQVRTFVDQFPVQHELRKRIFRRFQEEGIEIPYPIQTLFIKGGGNGNGGAAALGGSAEAIRVQAGGGGGGGASGRGGGVRGVGPGVDGAEATVET